MASRMPQIPRPTKLPLIRDQALLAAGSLVEPSKRRPVPKRSPTNPPSQKEGSTQAQRLKSTKRDRVFGLPGKVIDQPCRNRMAKKTKDKTLGARESRLAMAIKASPTPKVDTQGNRAPDVSKSREAIKATATAFSPTIRKGPTDSVPAQTKRSKRKPGPGRSLPDAISAPLAI